MGLLSRDQILGAEDLGHEDVDVPEWGGTIRVRGLSGAERDAYEGSMVQIRGDGSRHIRLQNIRAGLVSRVAIDENGQRLFSDADVTELGQKSAAALDRVWEVARRLSGLSEDDVKELAADFDDAPSDGSTSV